MPYFRDFDADADPGRLLDPDNQYSTPWGGADHGPCDKCEGAGTCEYRCLSCLESGSNPDCPACDGRVEFLGVCPTCAGSTQITRTRRRGVSVFPTVAGLLRYLVERGFDPSGSVIVELDGELAAEPDLDAETGALLIHPTEVKARHPIDPERVAELRARLVADAR